MEQARPGEYREGRDRYRLGVGWTYVGQDRYNRLQGHPLKCLGGTQNLGEKRMVEGL